MSEAGRPDNVRAAEAAAPGEHANARLAKHDATYAAYDDHPLSEPDEWGDLASFLAAAAGR